MDIPLRNFLGCALFETQILLTSHNTNQQHNNITTTTNNDNYNHQQYVIDMLCVRVEYDPYFSSMRFCGTESNKDQSIRVETWYTIYST